MDHIKQSVSNFPLICLIIPDLTIYLREKCDTFRAGNIANFVADWRALTSDREILSTVTGATIEFDAPPYPVISPTANFSSEETAIIDHEIEKFLENGIIEPTSHNPDEVLSSIFVRPKKDGGHRLILNLKGLNQFVTCHHFKMDTLNSMLKLVEKNCYMASLDPQGRELLGSGQTIIPEIPTIFVAY